MNANASVEQGEKPGMKRGILRWVLRNSIIVLVATACLFVSSGRLDWVMAWAFVGVLAAGKVVIAAVLLQSNPELLAERGGVPEDARDWDKPLAVLMALYGPAIVWIVAGLDKRFGWSPAVPLRLQTAALALSALATLVTIWAMASNRFFLGFCRIATERGHTVASGGPYRYVRHPGYLGAILYQLATPLALSSWWAFIPVALVLCVTVVRTALEDRTLQEELEGYQDYAQQVRYRLLPGVW
jgi:protein-S-isoprenylcysteine O-methyltransferase Ste14